MSYSNNEKFALFFPFIGGLFLAAVIIDFNSLEIEKIVAVVGLVGIWFVVMWAKIKDEQSKKGKKKPKTYAEEQEQEQQEALDSLKKHLEDQDRQERKKRHGF